MLRAGSVFSGIEGLGLGLERAGLCESVWFSEVDKGACKFLARQFPEIPNHGDISKIDWEEVEPVDVLHGGFPCQDISKAGKNAGIKEGTRSGLWFEYVRAIRILRPRVVVVENVAALLIRGLDLVLRDLAELGFDAEWTTLRASDVGAAHRRERVFLVATPTHADGERHVHGDTEIFSAVGRLDALGDAAASSGAPNSASKLRPSAQDAAGERPRSEEGHQAQGENSSRPTGRVSRPSSGSDANTDGEGLPERHGRGVSPGEGQGARSSVVASGGAAVDWGEFTPAIERWGRIIGRPAPFPLNKKNQLSVEFSEWHMGFPAGWVHGLTRNEALKCLGNAVVPQCGELIGHWALSIMGEK